MATYGLPVEINPVDALLQEVHRTAGHVAWLAERVKEVEQDELVWSKTREVDKTATENPGIDTTEQAVPHAWLILYRTERKHLIDVCRTAIAAGIEERRVKLAEAQGAMLADVIRAILNDLHLSPEQQRMVGEVVPRHLRAVS
jgi:isopropylmalate/homocitrate/citramalate synthase